MTYYFGVDVGATTTRCLVTTPELERVAHVSRPTAQGPTADAFTAGIDAVVEETFAVSGVAPGEVAGVGIASFGPLNADAGVVAETPNLDADLRNVPLRETVAGHFPGDTSVAMLNDAVAGAVAEHREGGDDANVVYLTLSSGVGAGVVVDDQLLRGRGGNAAEVGHFTLDPDSQRRCGCGGTGHWEAFASGENIPAYALELRDEEGFETALPTTREELSAAAVFDAAGEDPLATEVVDRVGRWNALGVANLVHAYAPDRVAVGGSVALNNPDDVVEPIRERVGDHLMVDAPAIHLTEFGDDVVVTGAVLAAVRAVRAGD
ncbi:ROK family protein [Halobacterium wangiae]|uniref:ROK family protein n=1 Tax=Halobacterium wangiae TaxID=2902623 RepID=UPI001E530A83|nr:ROK family protein [Halobacterium wangiae]